MKKIFVLVLCILTVTGCTDSSDIEEAKLLSLNQEIANLKGKIDSLEVDIENFNGQAEAQKSIIVRHELYIDELEKNVLDMQTMADEYYDIAYDYRADIERIFDIQRSSFGYESYPMKDIEYLSDEQQLVLMDAITQYVSSFYGADGDFPQFEVAGRMIFTPHIKEVIGIFESSHEIGQVENIEEALFFRVYYYDSLIPITVDEQSEKPYLEGMFGSWQTFSVNLEELDGEWVCTYCGVG